MATFREILNTVLRGIREDEIESSETELTTDYHKLVALFVNHIKEEVEAAHNWRDIQEVFSATVTALASDAIVTNASKLARVARMQGDSGLIPLVFDVTDPTSPIPLKEYPLAEINYRQMTDIPGTAVEPYAFALRSVGNDTLVIRVYPKPTTQRTISLVLFSPQPRLADDDLDEEVKVPSRPIEVGGIWYALQERGEELGTNSMFTEERFRNALDDAIASDSAEQGDNNLIVV
jgi:hypothetical protein